MKFSGVLWGVSPSVFIFALSKCGRSSLCSVMSSSSRMELLWGWLMRRRTGRHFVQGGCGLFRTHLGHSTTVPEAFSFTRCISCGFYVLLKSWLLAASFSVPSMVLWLTPCWHSGDPLLGRVKINQNARELAVRCPAGGFGEYFRGSGLFLLLDVV